MNPIIGTLVNGKTTSQQIRVFCLVLGLYLAAWKDKQIVLLIDFNAHLGILEKKGKKLSTKRHRISGLFQILKKTCQSRSYIAHTLYENYLVFSL